MQYTSFFVWRDICEMRFRTLSYYFPYNLVYINKYKISYDTVPTERGINWSSYTPAYITKWKISLAMRVVHKKSEQTLWERGRKIDISHTLCFNYSQSKVISNFFSIRIEYKRKPKQAQTRACKRRHIEYILCILLSHTCARHT